MILQLFKLLEIFDFLGFVVCTKVNHQVVRVEATDFRFGNVKHLVHIFYLATHRAFYVKRGFHLGDAINRNCGNHSKNNGNRLSVSQNKLTKIIEDEAHARIALFEHLGVRLFVLAKAQENRRNCKSHKENEPDSDRREDAHGADRLKHHRQERQKCHNRCESREQH